MAEDTAHERFEVFKRLRDEYCNESPNETVHSDSQNPNYKCRTGFYTALFLGIQLCAEEKIIDPKILDKIGELKKIFGPIDENGSLREFMRRNKTPEDIQTANEILGLVMGGLERYTRMKILGELKRNYPKTIDYLIINHGLPYHSKLIDENSSLVYSIDIAKRLIEDEKDPQIITCTHVEPSKKLIPLGYNSEIKWDRHHACMCDSLIFDIIYHRPLGIQEYAKTLFNSDINFSKYNMTKKLIEEWVV